MHGKQQNENIVMPNYPTLNFLSRHVHVY